MVPSADTAAPGRRRLPMELLIVVPGAVAPLPLYFLLQHASFLTIALAAGAFAGVWAVWAHYAEWALEGRHRPNPFDPKWLP